MLITEKKLREIIRKVIKESWRDSLPIVGIPKMGEEGYKDDVRISTDIAHNQHNSAQQNKQDSFYVRGEEDSAYSQKFYSDNNIDLNDAYSIANVFMNEPKNKIFKISDFEKVSKRGQDFRRHYFDIVDDEQEILDSELDELIFDSDKLGLSYSEF